MYGRLGPSDLVSDENCYKHLHVHYIALHCGVFADVGLETRILATVISVVSTHNRAAMSLAAWHWHARRLPFKPVQSASLSLCYSESDSGGLGGTSTMTVTR